MGYTHYFKQLTPVDSDAWDLICGDIRSLLDCSPVTIRNGSGDLFSYPSIDSDSIVFNGEDDTDDAYETFMLPRDMDRFNFCKTAHNPYDLLVVATLCVANYHAPSSYDIGSDGDAEQWQAGLDFAREVLNNRDLQIPNEIRVVDTSEVEYETTA